MNIEEENAMTPEEAGEKWCPFVRFLIGPDTASWQGIALTNRGEDFEGKKSCRCITYRCMAWRWKPDITSEEGWCGLVANRTDL